MTKKRFDKATIKQVAIIIGIGIFFVLLNALSRYLNAY